LVCSWSLIDPRHFYWSITVSALPERSEMTDRCGLINKSALMALRFKCDWPTFPTAIQMRLDGVVCFIYCPFILLNLGQGILCRCNDDADNLLNDLWAGLRPSQRKIKHPPDDVSDPAILIIDVIQSSHMRAPTQTITNLAEIGVPHEVFIKLLHDGLEE
jgi:RNA-dependent RNA polymerase